MATSASRISSSSGGPVNSSSSSTAKILCRYFASGACREGSRCQFSHDRADRPSNVCRFYLNGNCAYGSGCRYDHIRPAVTRPQSSTTTSSSVGVSKKSDCSPVEKSKLRADAADFIPHGTLNYAEIVSGNLQDMSISGDPQSDKDLICPYFIIGHCFYGDACSYTHGEMCDLCQRPVLHPTNTEHNAKHREECIAEHEKDMEESFAIARSVDKVCGICMETVVEKKGNDAARRFGILPNCRHVFCLTCIRTWRQSHTFENQIVRACPQCRTVSDFVTPSPLWVEEEPEKSRLIETYKKAMKEKPCKYFKLGSVTTECPFGNQCFYKHANPDGTLVPGDSPRTIRRRIRRRQAAQDEAAGGGRHDSSSGGSFAGDFFREYFLWSFLEDRDNQSSEENSVSSNSRRRSGSAAVRTQDPRAVRDVRLHWLLSLDVTDDLADFSAESDSDSDDPDLWRFA